MAARHSFIKAGGEVYGRFDADLTRRLDLCAEQVEMKIRVHFVCLGGMICPAVMAFGKQRDGIHVTDFQRVLKLFF